MTRKPGTGSYLIVAICLGTLGTKSFAQASKMNGQYEESSRRCAASESEHINTLNNTVANNKQSSTYFAAAANCISKQSFGIDSRLIRMDQGVFVRAYPEIEAFYSSRGHSSKESSKIAVLAWAQYRSKHPSGQLTEASLIVASKSLGELVVKSHPPGAAVEVDETLWDGNTDISDWTSSGKHPIKLTKEGCKPVEGTVNVPATGSVTFEKTLNCAK